MIRYFLRQELLLRIFEEFTDEWSREVHCEHLVVGSSMLRNQLNGFRRNRQEESSDVVELGLLNYMRHI